MKTKLKSDDWFKSYGPINEVTAWQPTGGSHLVHITQQAPYVQMNLCFLFGCMRFSTVLVSYLTFYPTMSLTMWRNSEQLFVAMMLHSLALGTRV